MAQTKGGYPGYGIIYPQDATVGFRYVRICTEGSKKVRHGDGSFEYVPGHPTVMELVGGAFAYESGKPVNKKEDLDHLPPSMRAKAMAWFNSQRDIPEEAIVKDPEEAEKKEPGAPWILSSDISNIQDYAEGQTQKAVREIPKTVTPVVNKSDNTVLQALDAIMGKLGTVVETIQSQGERIALIEKGTPKQSDRLVMARKSQSEKMKQRWAERKRAAQEAAQVQTEGVSDGGHTPETNEEVQAV